MDSSKNILIFRTGQLGDTLVSVPALHAVKGKYPAVQITLLHDVHPSQRYVLASKVLEHSGLIDRFLYYDPADKQLWNLLQTILKIRNAKFDLLIYLPQSSRTLKQVHRDQFFFRLCGISKLVGFENFRELESPLNHKKPLPIVIHEADFLLNRLKTSGFAIPRISHGNVDLSMSHIEENAVDQWLKALRSDGKRLWVGVGPGSKMEAKIWPEEKFFSVVEKLIQSFDVWPVVFGGPEDSEIGNRLIRKWGRGYVAAGHLGIREGIAALSRCEMFLGNDTGTIHMAVAAGIKCVGIYSARDYPGKWYPYGHGHRVLRKKMTCEGCMLENCKQHPHCLTTISEEEVLRECKEIISTVDNCLSLTTSDYSR